MDDVEYFSLSSDPPSEIMEKPNLTWLDAAQVSINYWLLSDFTTDCHFFSEHTLFLVQIVLEEAGRPMHIKEIKQRIIDRGLVQSKYDSCPQFKIKENIKIKMSPSP